MKTLIGLLALPLALAGAPAYAQGFPERPVTLIVPFVAGGGADAVGRVVAQGMGGPLKQTIIVENVGGAGGTLGAGRGARAQPDGYTLTLTHVGQPVSATLYRKLPYDPIEGFEAIGMIAVVPMALVGRKDFPAKDAAELISIIKAKKEGITNANGGVGSASHLCGLLLMSALQTQMQVVPYRSAAPAMTDVVGGRIDLLCDQTAVTNQQIKTGNVKGYAVTTRTRLPGMPDLPTLDEAGLPGFELGVWFGLLAPKGTPRPIVDRLAAALRVAIADPAVIKRLDEFGAQLGAKEHSDPDQFGKYMRSEAAKWRPIITAAGAYAD